MNSEQAVDKVKRALHAAVDDMHADLARIELLAAALGAFSKPIPDYEPSFQHMGHMTLRKHEMH